MDSQLAEIERLSRLYSALSLINQAIVRTRSRPELLSKVCDILVDDGGFGMAWIGWHDTATRRLVPLARAGDDSGYLDSVEIYTDERREGQGPSGTAFRTNKAYICNDLLHDPSTTPWRAELERRGLGASAVLPIQSNGVAVGTLNVYAASSGFFRDKEVKLLSGAADDISFALDNIAREEARERAETIVRRFVAIVESTDDAILSKTFDGTITSWNPAAERMFGYSAAEIVGRSVMMLIPDERAGEESAIVERIRDGRRVEQFETVRIRKDGTRFPVSITVSPIFGPSEPSSASTIVGISKIVRDITARKRVESAADNERRFANGVIAAMPGILYLYDDEGRFLRWNRNFETVSGYRADEIAAMRPLDFFTDDEKKLVEERIAEVFEKGEANVEAAFVSKDGTRTPYFFTGKRIQLDGASRLVGVGVDIAERKKTEDELRRSEERHRTTLDTILEGGQLISFDWRYLYLNPAAAIQNRRPNAELLGATMPEAWPGIESTELFALLRHCMNDRVAVQAEIDFTFDDGSTGWFDVRAQPVPEGIFVLSIDISKRKSAEKGLRELNETLERKVAERTVALEAARERAEAADRVKSAFLATMSHELRTPLNSIIGFTGILLKGLAGALNAEQSKQLGMVQGSARHLLDLINDVLDISKIEAGQLEVRCATFDLRASLERVVSLVTPLADKKGLSLTLTVAEALGSMESDRRRLEQILLNLLNNAIKFTDVGTIGLTVDIVDPERSDPGLGHRTVRFRVSDTGMGMKETDLALLFQPFRQIDSGLQRQHEGTGLGLAISRRLAELLGGSIGVESVWGEGSVFSLFLPLKTSGSR